MQAFHIELREGAPVQRNVVAVGVRICLGVHTEADHPARKELVTGREMSACCIQKSLVAWLESYVSARAIESCLPCELVLQLEAAHFACVQEHVLGEAPPD